MLSEKQIESDQQILRLPEGELVLDPGPHAALAAVGLRADLYAGKSSSRIAYLDAFDVTAIRSNGTH